MAIQYLISLAPPSPQKPHMINNTNQWEVEEDVTVWSLEIERRRGERTLSAPLRSFNSIISEDRSPLQFNRATLKEESSPSIVSTER